MAIYIKEMEAPEHCDLCPFQKYDGYEIQPFWYCLFTGLKIDHSLVPSGNNCPLVYIPEPHGRLIDADLLAKEMRKGQQTSKAKVWALLTKYAPTVIERSE